MGNRMMCERCDGSGADPMQYGRVDDVTVCVDCGGDGYILIAFVQQELLATA
jgi:DnaJ-class molecular chaperone